MKIEQTLQSEFPPDVIDLINRYLSERPRTFSERVKYLGLNPAQDFRYADLAFEDFSFSDIRGYDFSGADLRGATGSNIIWDQSTLLDGADVSHSFLSYEIAKGEFFRENLDLKERVDRLKGEYWANTIITVHDVLGDFKMDKRARIKFAEAVFDKVKDRTVRSDILTVLGSAYNSAAEHKEFLYNVLARGSDDPVILAVVLRTLGIFHPKDLDAFNTLRRFLQHNDASVVRSAIEGVFASKHFFTGYSEILSITKASKNPFMRRALTERIVRKEFGVVAMIFADDLINNFIDYEEIISRKRLERIARRSFTYVPPSLTKGLEKHLGVRSRSTSDQDQIRADLIIRCAKHLEEKYGVSFRLES